MNFKISFTSIHWPITLLKLLISYSLSASNPVLVPDTGFNGPTAQPSPVGTSVMKGYDAKAIARWDVVPFQTVDKIVSIGIVAFHINGIDRVEFSLEGGPWTAVDTMTINPETNVNEYWVKIDPSLLTDGDIEIRAIIYPSIAGIPRVLAGAYDMKNNDARIRGEHSLFLNSNGNGTLLKPIRWVSVTGNDSTGTGSQNNPFQTIAKASEDIQNTYGSADDAIIYLGKGDYDYGQTATSLIPKTSKGWITICAAPGLPRDSVRITSSSGNGLATHLVCFRNITLHSLSIPAGGSNKYNAVWADSAILEGTGPLDNDGLIFRGANWTGGVYSTGTTYRQSIRAVHGARLVRNALVHDIGGDAFREVRGLIANVEIRNLVHVPSSTIHNDVMQFFSNIGNDPFENIILFGLQAVDSIAGQSLFVAANDSNGIHRDWAIVNYITRATGGGGAQWGNPAEHILIWHYTNIGQTFILVEGSDSIVTNIKNFSVRNSIFTALKFSHKGNEPNMTDQSWADNNHFIDTSSYKALIAGTNATGGGILDTLFINPSANDYRPKNFILLNRVNQANLLVNTDTRNNSFVFSAAIGALQPPAVSYAGINENKKSSEIFVYPNPSSGVINIHTGSFFVNNTSLCIIDVRGAVVYSEDQHNVNGKYNRTINLNDFSKGIYFLQVRANNEYFNKKIIIE